MKARSPVVDGWLLTIYKRMNNLPILLILASLGLSACATYHPESQWEYKFITNTEVMERGLKNAKYNENEKIIAEINQMFNDLGEDRWEYVSRDHMKNLIFKRRKSSPNK